MPSWDKLWPKDTNRPKNPTVTSEQHGAETCLLHSAQWGGQTAQATRPYSLDVPTLPPYKEQTCPPTPAQGVRERGNVLPVPTPSCYSRGPKKALLEFLAWRLINFHQRGKVRNPSQYHEHESTLRMETIYQGGQVWEDKRS